MKRYLTQGQIEMVLMDIAITARQIDRFSAMLVQLESGDLDGAVEREAIHHAIGCMAQRIGWKADLTAGGLKDGIGPCIGSAEEWMMQPAYHDAADPSASTHITEGGAV